MSLLQDTWALFRRYFTKLLRNPTLLVTNLPLFISISLCIIALLISGGTI